VTIASCPEEQKVWLFVDLINFTIISFIFNIGYIQGCFSDTIISNMLNICLSFRDIQATENKNGFGANLCWTGTL
jgi:hypothetical protein